MLKEDNLQSNSTKYLKIYDSQKDKKQLKKEIHPFINSGSTLSLHIAAYENVIKAKEESLLFNFPNQKRSNCRKAWKNLKHFLNGSTTKV